MTELGRGQAQVPHDAKRVARVSAIVEQPAAWGIRERDRLISPFLVHSSSNFASEYECALPEEERAFWTFLNRASAHPLVKAAKMQSSTK